MRCTAQSPYWARMMLASSGLANPVRVPRFAAFHYGLFLFEHRDSRGGDTIVEAPTLSAAAAIYNAACGGGPEVELPDWAAADYSGLIDVAIFDRDLPRERWDLIELLADYGGHWTAGSVVVDGMILCHALWRGEAPPAWSHEGRMIRVVTADDPTGPDGVWSPGEDAFGLLAANEG